MPDRDCPVNGVNCVSITRVEALERALEAEKESRSRTNEKIFDRLGELERGMATVSTQYSNIADRLATISADLNAIKERPRGLGWDKSGAEQIARPQKWGRVFVCNFVCNFKSSICVFCFQYGYFIFVRNTAIYWESKRKAGTLENQRLPLWCR